MAAAKKPSRAARGSPQAGRATAKKSVSAPRPPADASRDLFLVWRMPRIGARNPHRLTNPIWAWLASRPELSAYAANRHFQGPSSMLVGPCWCGHRFGQSATALPDGRVVAVGGEHEDHYDPDFYIYNDVVVTDPSGQVEIYGYPYEVFPPTDFHSATCVGDRVVVVGCLGHPGQRVVGVTPVYAIDTGTFAITRLETAGEPPGWIFKHAAELSSDQMSIMVRGGERMVQRDDAQVFVENTDDWSLDLGTLAWTRLTDRRWPVWELARTDGSPNQLHELQWRIWSLGRETPFGGELPAQGESAIGRIPDKDLYAARFSPPLQHTSVAVDPEVSPRTTRITVDGVAVRYVEDIWYVRITVEGSLAPEVIEVLVADARGKLEALEQCPYNVRRLSG